MPKLLSFMTVFLFLGGLWYCGPLRRQDLRKTCSGHSAGEVTITFLGHGTLMFSFGGRVIHVDPYSKVADYSALPKADAVLITHEHQDHLDTER